MTVIDVQHLTKEYQLGALEGLGQALANAGSRLVGRPVVQQEPFKALDDVSFSVEAGEVVGIIGHNGAGKSTLLKMLARISTPTSGSVRVEGRVSPLIEVGAGFVGDFTGRENVYLNGTILGMSRQEIRKKFDEIVEFSEVGSFIDTPIKRFSSGMQVKLAFAVATSVESEILIVDEVLAVGDLAFQRKCFDRIDSIIRDRGTTILVVSHNLRQISRLCNRVILLESGRIAMDDACAPVVQAFYERNNNRIRSNHAASGRVRRSDTTGEVELLDASVVDVNGNEVQHIRSGEPLRIRLRLDVKQPVESAEIIVGTHTTDFFYLTGNSTGALNKSLNLEQGIQVIECTLESFPLIQGTYCIRYAVFDRRGREMASAEMVTTFYVNPTAAAAGQPKLRNLTIPASWKVSSDSASLKSATDELTVAAG